MKKSIPIIWEEVFIPGNGREQEFLLSPDIELFDVNLIMMPMPGECIPSQRVNSREWQRIHHHYHLADQAGAVGIKEEEVKAAKKNPGQEMLEKEVMMIFKDKRCLKYCVVKISQTGCKTKWKY